MRIFLCVSFVLMTQIARADTDYEWQAKAAALAINMRYEQPPLVTQTNPAPWVLSPGVNKQQPQMVAPQPQAAAPQPSVATVVQRRAVTTTTRPFVFSDFVGQVVDPNNCPPEG